MMIITFIYLFYKCEIIRGERKSSVWDVNMIYNSETDNINDTLTCARFADISV